MRRIWTESSALSVVNKGDVEIRGRRIVIGKRGLSGLTACGALDYLVNYCGYFA